MKNKNRTEKNLYCKIHDFVDMIFEDIPYSDEVNEAYSKIEMTLDTEFDKIKADRREDEALEDLLGKYGRLSNMAELITIHSDSTWELEQIPLDSITYYFNF